MSGRVTITRQRLPLRHAFGLATGTTTERTSFAVALHEASGRVGRGEATPLHYLGETPDSLAAALREIAAPDGPLDRLLREGAPGSLADLEACERRLDAAWPDAPAARNAVSVALHDLAAQRAGQPLWRFLGAPSSETPPTSFTIGIAAPAEVRARTAEAVARGLDVIKLKVGREGDEDDDLALVEAVREVHDGVLMIDANGGWDEARAHRRIEQLAPLRPTLVEQPLPRGEVAALARLAADSPLPIWVDEDSLDESDLVRLPDGLGGINVKLMKCGGVSAARRMITAARGRGWGVMLGCMVQSTLGITAAAHLAPLVDHADLDAPLLIAEDPWRGVGYEGSRLVLPEAPGLGVTARLDG